MSRPNFATSFAPYQPPPDDPSYASSSRQATRPWLPSLSAQQSMSYQSGGVPTFNTSQAGGEDVEAEAASSIWETRFGMRVDMLAAFAYVFGPISALLMLILETHNDYVRFHAYQSALLTGPLLLLRIIAALLQFPALICTFFTLLLVVSCLYMIWRSYIDAARNGLVRFQLPWIGPMADQWVAEE
ncbi:uncharacterized protein C8Q71DRAFT_762595 [Rhodofomes roseus]|uniref:Transmembrane protein n=1 Tax=Rhodofomes roseus TaxID=34475 RepID=A0ABQ8KD37_9APHY|nr:uncharacterized protein C8Q71DRAFT_762595 [Rhodofomes roseus]KAH9835564.1 hypothetical protein C8Q71DRAFT_762595 [Rhodofomes roseus]